ncbi:hypothetical protein OESDEN_23484, partial [Oesophagostomum dentatum]
LFLDECESHPDDCGPEEEARPNEEKAQNLLSKENDRRSEKNEPVVPQVQQLLPSSVAKNHIMLRYQQLEQAMMKQALNTGKSVMDWMNDEDFLYCRIIGVRLKKMEPRKRKRIRAQIMNLLEESENELEEDDDSMSSPNMDGGESSGYDHSLLDGTNDH